MTRGPIICPLAPAHLAGVAAFQAAIILLFIDYRLSAVPLALFLIACFAAPFFPRSRFFLPVISRGRRDRPLVALTFDDGPDPATTPRLLELLGRKHARATFFVTGERAERYPHLVREILGRGHTIGNHSYRHSPFLILASLSRLRDEIRRTQDVCTDLGATPRAFRPPVGITNPRLWRPLIEEGLFCLTWSRRGRDAGNRRIANLAARIARGAKPGDIILLHDVAPNHTFDVDRWLAEIGTLLQRLGERGLSVAPLEELIRRPVQDARIRRDSPAAAFYDAIAETYDDERTDSSSLVFTAERELVRTNLLTQLSPHHRVCDIGAGTGIFTLLLAERCREVTAVDVSPRMCARLAAKAAQAGLSNIRIIVDDIETFDPGECYDVICSFSALEYVRNIRTFIRHISSSLRPGGLFYCTTSHHSPFRLFTQIGNAMRQGIWLASRSKRALRAALREAGFTEIAITTHVLKLPFVGGMLIEASARKPK